MNHHQLFINEVSELAGFRIDKSHRGTFLHPHKSISIYVLYQYTGMTHLELARLYKCCYKNIHFVISRNRDYVATGEMEICKLYNDLSDLYIRCCRTYLKLNVPGS